MKESIMNRVKALELLCYDDPLLVLARHEKTGEEKVLSVDQLLKHKEYTMLHVCGGSSLKDLDKLLASIREEAFKQEGADT